MVEVKISGMVIDKKSNSPVMLLQEPGSSRYLPIWIGHAEANAIAMVLAKRSFERPLTHDLLKHVIDGLGAVVTRIVITSLQENTFFAKIYLARDHEIIAIDARPSDSVALALRAGAPIFLSDELMAAQAENMLEMDEEARRRDVNDQRSSVEELIRDVEMGASLGDLDLEEDEDEEDGD